MLSNDNTYVSKFYEPHVQAIIEQNRTIFEPDAEAITEALDSFKNNQGIVHSYDCINDQENDDMHSEVKDYSIEEETFNKQLPAHLDSASNNTKVSRQG